ncbi:hypothetical protein XM38_006040 [Halomicronema hongdechloris C2206]|uniref:Transglutaminase-like domain-containing protein n=1 Tax=Halomicronema hongdechloris C2206 TaxID=1641165 RepID=A0A1Z3HHB5_9CYAN|nr:transglutaminase family protein [Halomicronema hongdechloris]ASC69675.1 hypothetical protein XM38_006040 [Halomicronema hongdechloris C2206]
MARYRIHHITLYRYDRAVKLHSHVVRLRPRSDGTQTLEYFDLRIDPLPVYQADLVDLDGNATVGLWFDQTDATELHIKASSEIRTHRKNPFDYLIAPWAVNAPIIYPQSLASYLHPYCDNSTGLVSDPGVTQLAHRILHDAQHNISCFLTTLTQHIYETCRYTTREQGEPQLAGITWHQKLGSCRDFTVLFMEACRSVGLAARFVSGYQEGDLTVAERELHAWAEVYIPGGGWRGFDPTHGLAVADQHIALAASAFPKDASPVSGKLQGSHRDSTLDTHITIEKLAD